MDNVATKRSRNALAGLGVAVFAITVARTAWLERGAYRDFFALREAFGEMSETRRVVMDATLGAQPMWDLLIAAAILVTGEIFFTPLAVAAICSVAAIAIVLFRVAPSVGAVCLVTIGTICSSAFVDFASSGHAFPLVYLMLAGFYALYFGDKTGPDVAFSLAALTALLALTRFETVLLTVIPLMTWLATSGRSIKHLLLSLVGLLPLMFWAALRVRNGGMDLDFVDGDAPATRGLWYFVYTLRNDPATLLQIVAGIATTGVVRKGKHTAVAIGVLLTLGYIILMRGEAMAGRLFAPSLLVSIVLLALTPQVSKVAVDLPILVVIGILGYFAASPPLASESTFGEVPSESWHGIRNEREHTFQSRSLYQWRRGTVMPLDNIEPRNNRPPRPSRRQPPPDLDTEMKSQGKPLDKAIEESDRTASGKKQKKTKKQSKRRPPTKTTRSE